MSKTFYVALVCLVVSSMALGVALERSFDQDYPKDMRFYMYCEKCSECGYEEKEVEYSTISNVGHSGCPQCQSSYEFELDNNGNKIIIKGE